MKELEPGNFYQLVQICLEFVPLKVSKTLLLSTVAFLWQQLLKGKSKLSETLRKQILDLFEQAY